jgi:Cyclic nucleotide-binding domain
MKQRIESSVTSVSWIPSEAMEGPFRLGFDLGLQHWDDPLDVELDDIDRWRREGRFRFANELRAWLVVDDGRIVDHGYSGQGHIGDTRVGIGPASITIAAVPMPPIQEEPTAGPDFVDFVQSCGARTGGPMPRRVRRPPYVQVTSPIAWTTLRLRIHTDGHADWELGGSSPFPRHWIYDEGRRLVAKSGLMDSRRWLEETFVAGTPWGGQDSPAVVMAVETALERALSAQVMRGRRRPEFRVVEPGGALTEQGQPGDELYVLLDGVLRAEVDGSPVNEIGPGAILGERALLEDGRRSATLRAVTRCRVAVAPPDSIALDQLAAVAESHR